MSEKRTLGSLIDEGNSTCGERSLIAEIAAAAYWAGQSDMRGTITRKIAGRLGSLPAVRYHGIQAATARHLTSIYELNPNVLRNPEGPYDDGSGEAAEIKCWDFSV